MFDQYETVVFSVQNEVFFIKYAVVCITSKESQRPLNGRLEVVTQVDIIIRKL